MQYPQNQSCCGSNASVNGWSYCGCGNQYPVVPGTNPALQTWNGQNFVVADGSAQNRISLPFLQVNGGAATYVVGADNNGVWSYYNPAYVGYANNINGGSAGQVPWQISTNVTGFTTTGTTGQLLQSGATNSPTWIAPNNLLVTATGSTTARTLSNRFADVVNVKDFGAVGDGLTDDTAAINAAIVSGAGKAVFFPAGTYKITSTILVNSSNTGLIGLSSHNTILLGNFVSGDIIRVGNSTSQIYGVSVCGITVDSSVNKTSGAALNFTKVVRSTIRDVVAAGQDSAQVNKYLWDGFVFSGFDLITLSNFQSCVKNKGISISAYPSSGTLAGDLFIEQGRIQFCSLGMHVGGGVGGLSVCQIDILNNDSSLLIDSSLYSTETNRDAWFGPNCFFDSTTGNNVVINNGICNLICFSNTSIATCGGINLLVNSMQGNLVLDSVLIADAVVDGIRVNDANCAVSMFGCVIENNQQYGYNQNVTPSNYSDINFGGSIFKLNGSGETRNISTVKSTSYASTTEFAAIGGNANINLSVTPKGSGAFIVSSSGNGPMFYVQQPGTSGTYINIPSVKPSILGGNVVYGVSSSGNSNVEFATAGTGAFIWTTNAVNRIAIDGSSGVFRPLSDNAYSCGQSGSRWSSIWAANGAIQTSDSRTKTEIKDAPLGLDFIKALRPVAYKFKIGSNKVIKQVYRDTEGKEVDANSEGSLPSEIITEPVAGKRLHYGLIAQQVKEVLPDGVDFGGWILTDKNDPDSEQGLRYEEFISPLIKAVQELSEQNKSLANVVNDLTSRLEALESK